jgi:serine phosphatase RsbU (regulator of sigma subunit)
VGRPGEDVEDRVGTRHDGTALLSLQADVDALSAELLDRYEEIALLYDLSRELGVVTDLASSAHTALSRTLQVIPARWGVIVVGSSPQDMHDVAVAGRDPDRTSAAVARGAAAAAVRSGAQVMVHAGGLVDLDLPTAEPVLAVPLVTRFGAGDGLSTAGVLVLVGHDRDDRFSASDAQLATAVARQLSLGLENARTVAQLREKEGLDRELELAAEIQRSLLPATAPFLSNASLAAACLPAAHVGGDYFDFVPGGDGVVHVVVADVTGHGLGPGMIMAMTRITLRAELSGPQSLAGAVAATNRVMWDDLVATAAFITLYAVRFDSSTRELTYVNGGHHPALLRHLDGSVEDLDADGMPLGLLSDTPYQEVTRVLEPGDLVVMFSDGIVEASAPDATMYGTQRLRQLVANAGPGSAEATLATLLADLKEYLAGAVQDDDVTVVVLQVAPFAGERLST